jgi:membrane-bound serine protease (ClpP class)
MKSFQLFFALAALALVALCVSDASAQQGAVYVIEITGEVDQGLPPYVRRIFAEAEEAHAAAVAIRVNTFGGRVDVATEVRDIILNSKLPTIAYVDKRAISAGALITLSADSIAMAPGGTIGAATPVHENGEKASEKVVSYMRSEMRATAEQNGRDPAVAEAMVDEALTLGDSSLKLPGQLLTLTTTEAIGVDYCDAEAASLSDALARFGFGNREVVTTSLTWSENLVAFLTSPMMSSVLIMLGLGGLFYGIKTGHFGAVASIGLGSLTLFFGAQYLAELANFVEILMFLAGIVLLAIEVFVIPGFGVVGILGIVMMLASLFLALGGSFSPMTYESLTIPLYTLAASFVGLAIMIGLMVRYLPTSSAFSHLVLQAPPPALATNRELATVRELLGSEGRALTTLRPAGVALLRDERCDVITDGEYIAAGEPVRVVRVEGRKVVVRRSDSPALEA